MRAVKIRAVQENRKLKDMVAKLLELGLAHEPGEPGTARERVQLPLVQCAREAPPDEEMTPDRVAEVLLEEERQRASAGAREPVR